MMELHIKFTTYLAVSTQSTSVADKDRQPNRRTDRQNFYIAIAYMSRFAIATR